jgi:AraC family transcriptional activator of tynA and feaB
VIGAVRSASKESSELKNSFPRIRSGNLVRLTGNDASWSMGLSGLFVELEVEILNPDRSMDGWMFQLPFGELTFVRAVTWGAHRTKRTTSLIGSSTQNFFFVGFMLRGTALLRQDGQTAELARGDIAVLDCTREYEIEVPHAFDALWVAVPRHRLDTRMRSPRNSMARRVNGNTGIGHLASNLLIAALEEAATLSQLQANRISNHVLDLVALCLDQQHASGTNRRGTSHQHTLLNRLQLFIDQNIDDEGLSISTIARAHSISIRYVRKLFEREGTSVGRWIRLRRLERCRIDLEDNHCRERTIAEIAFSHGFQNITSFNRTFKAQFGMAPNAMRSRRHGDRQSDSIDQ